MKDASCIDEDQRLFTSFDLEKIDQAKDICNSCPVKKECIIFQGDTTYIAGGFTKYERLKLTWKRITSLEDKNWDGFD